MRSRPGAHELRQATPGQETRGRARGKPAPGRAGVERTLRSPARHTGPLPVTGARFGHLVKVEIKGQRIVRAGVQRVVRAGRRLWGATERPEPPSKEAGAWRGPRLPGDGGTAVRAGPPGRRHLGLRIATAAGRNGGGASLPTVTL